MKLCQTKTQSAMTQTKALDKHMVTVLLASLLKSFFLQQRNMPVKELIQSSTEEK